MPGGGDDGSGEDQGRGFDSVADAAEHESAPQPFKDAIERTDEDLRLAEHLRDEAVRSVEEEMSRVRKRERLKLYQLGWAGGAVAGVLAVAFLIVALSSDEEGDASSTSASVAPPTTASVASAPAPAQYWEVNASMNTGYRSGPTARQHGGTIYLLLELDDGPDADPLRPRYRIADGQVVFPAFQTPNASGSCTYTSAGIESKVSQDHFFDGARVGFLEFDLDADPATYASYISLTEITWFISHSCVDGGSGTNDQAGGSIRWVDQQSHASPTSGSIEAGYFEGEDIDPGNEGFVDLRWNISECGRPERHCLIDYETTG